MNEADVAAPTPPPPIETLPVRQPDSDPPVATAEDMPIEFIPAALPAERIWPRVFPGL